MAVLSFQDEDEEEKDSSNKREGRAGLNKRSCRPAATSKSTHGLHGIDRVKRIAIASPQSAVPLAKERLLPGRGRSNNFWAASHALRYHVVASWRVMISLSVLVIFRDEGAGVCSHLQPPSRRLENSLRSRLESFRCLYHRHTSRWHRYQMQDCCVKVYLYKTLLPLVNTLDIQDGRRSEALLAAWAAPRQKIGLSKLHLGLRSLQTARSLESPKQPPHLTQITHACVRKMFACVVTSTSTVVVPLLEC